jgi:hypothetical protein
MDTLFESAGRTLAAAYAAYLGLLGVLGLVGVHAGVLAVLLYLTWRRRPDGHLLPLELVYGFVNPLIYLLVFEPYGAFRPRKAIDDWMDAAAWTLFAAIWGTRVLLPRPFEMSPAARARLARLCLLGLATLAIFALSDVTRVWGISARSGNPAFRPGWGSAWLLLAFAPLYVIPAVLLNRYRLQLTRTQGALGFLLLSRQSARRVAFTMGVLALAILTVSLYRPSDASARARISQLAPVIAEAASRYQIDPLLLAAIVYVTEREQNKPFRDEFESLASAAFLLDDGGHLLLSKPFDFSLGLAQIKPVTALTALKVCRASGKPWDLWFKHLREVPELGREWQLGPDAEVACQPPLLPVPVNKPEVVSALMRDDDNIAFAAMILALYRWQWRTANPDWDIASRPDILATLYQIGFEKSHPHAAPRSNAFGARVAEVSRQGWLRERFEGPRLALTRSDQPR